MGEPGYAAALGPRMKLTTFVPGKSVRNALRGGFVEVIRRPLSQAPDFVSRQWRPRIVLVHLSPPDSLGRMSLGVSCDTMPALLSGDAVVVAEISDGIPRTRGANSVTVDQIDYWIEGNGTPLKVEPVAGEAVDHAIADNVAEIIVDGDVIQNGIGIIPDLILTRLLQRNRLGMRTGIITEAAQPLIERGIIANASTEFGDRIVATMAAGSQGFYRFLHDNAAVAFYPCSLTHHHQRLASIPRLCAINSALEVDLSGRVNAEVADGRPVSGPGGQPDFAKGAKASPGGKSIVALRATNKGGSASRIVRSFLEATPVTIDARAVDYVVTEFGVARIADLFGEGLRRALAGVAAPQFRAGLLMD